MSKWHSILEVIQFPLKILFIGTLLLGIGTIALNQNVAFLWHFDQPLLVKVLELIRYVGASIVYFFPFLVFIQVLSHKYESSITVLIGVLSYVLINISMVFFLDNTFPAYYYQSLFNTTTINFDKISGVIANTISPYNIGIFGYILAYLITHACYLRSRRYSIFGVTSFVDHDSVAGILTLIMSVLCGFVLAYAWPLAMNGLTSFFELIASDISNPVNLLLYGMFERLSALLGLLDIPRQIFWFSDMGGSWLNNVGLKISGDVAIWTAQREAGMNSLTAGTFVTPYYIINLFMIPSFILAYYKLCSSLEDRKRYFGFIVIALLLSVMCGNPLPAEVLMLVLSPMLYLVYIVIIGILYAFLQMFHVVIGYSFKELLILANPGSGLDLLEYLRNPYVAYNVYKLLLIGLLVGILFYVLTKRYFKKYAFGLFQMVDKEKTCADIVEKLGGFDNIVNVDSTPDKLTVKFVNRDLVNYDELRKFGAYLMLESKNGYLIRLGNVSTIVRDYILENKKKSIEEFKQVEIKETVEEENK